MRRTKILIIIVIKIIIISNNNSNNSNKVDYRRNSIIEKKNRQTSLTWLESLSGKRAKKLFSC